MSTAVLKGHSEDSGAARASGGHGRHAISDLIHVDWPDSLQKNEAVNGTGPTFLRRMACWFKRKPLAPHLRYGQLGEREAKKHLRRLGMKFLTANFRTERGEIDLVMRDQDCLQFVHIAVNK